MTYANIDFWEKFKGTVIDEKTDFEKNPGDSVPFVLNAKLTDKPSYNDEKVVPENCSDWMDNVEVDDEKEFVTDEIIFAIISGANGDNIINDRCFQDESYGGNTITPPDVEHMFYGGNATSKASLADSDKMSVDLIYKVGEKCRKMNNDNFMHPIKINAEKYYIMIMSPVQHWDMRQSYDTYFRKSIKEEVRKIEENVKSLDNNNNKYLIFEDAFGIINNVILHESAGIRLFNDYGPEQNMEAARALFLGNQSLIFANGADSKGNICGIKKTKFRCRDYGVCAVDTAYSWPLA